MAKYSSGKRAYVMDDRTGRKVLYTDTKIEWTGARVHRKEWEAKHPNLYPGRTYIDAITTLANPRSDNFIEDSHMNYNALSGDWTVPRELDTSHQGVRAAVSLGVPTYSDGT